MKKTILLFAVILMCGIQAIAQHWVTQGLGWTATSRGVQNISIVNDQVAWVAGYDGSGAGAACQDVSVTTNGGTTWTPHVINGATGLTTSMITALDANTAWAAMYKVSGSSLQGVYKTTDGGTTWTRQGTASMYTNANSFPDVVYFWDANTGVTLGDPINGNFEVYTTTDGGTTWTQTPAANITPAPITGEYGYTSDCSVVGNTIWIGTNKGHVYKSTDQGLNWTGVIPAGMSNKNTFPCFRDANNGFCLKFYVGADTVNLLAHSTDGGATYTAFPYTGQVFSQQMVFVPNSGNTFVTVGVDGTYATRLGLSYSFDDGASWFLDAELYQTQITWTTWLNNSVAYAGSFNSGATDGIYKFNSVLEPPVADFIASDTAIELGGSVQFTDQSTGGNTAWHWTFQDGTPPSSNAQNPAPIVYSKSGAHDVTLKVTNAWGNNTLVKSGYIYVGGMGINEHSSTSVTIFPNPVTNVMKVQSDQLMKELSVFNMVGQSVYNQKVDGKNVTINSLNLKPGVYNVRVTLENGFSNIKVVIN